MNGNSVRVDIPFTDLLDLKTQYDQVKHVTTALINAGATIQASEVLAVLTGNYPALNTRVGVLKSWMNHQTKSHIFIFTPHERKNDNEGLSSNPKSTEGAETTGNAEASDT